MEFGKSTTNGLWHADLVTGRLSHVLLRGRLDVSGLSQTSRGCRRNGIRAITRSQEKLLILCIAFAFIYFRNITEVCGDYSALAL